MEDTTPKDEAKPTSKSDVEKAVESHIHYSKNDDDLLDVHIGNPLHKIVLLLQDIKKQKAFSFTLKGSVGIAGVVLVFSFLGVLGAGNVLCTKGTQTEIGTLKVLNIKQDPPSTIPFLGNLINWINNVPYFPASTVAPNRTVLVKIDESAIFLPYQPGVKLAQYNNLPVAATGSYDACSQTLTVEEPENIETYLSN